MLIENEDITLFLLGEGLILRGTHLNRIQLLFVHELVLLLLGKLRPEGLGYVITEICTLGVAHLFIIYCRVKNYIYWMGITNSTDFIGSNFGRNFSTKL